MSTDIVSQFTESALDTVDSCIRIGPTDFEETLADLVVDPAVGAPLTSETVSLADTSVDTDPSLDALEAAATGVTQAGVGVANYGTITVESRPGGDEVVSLYPRRHVVVLEAADIVPDLTAAFERFETSIRDARDSGAAGASRVLATGPSATADMGALVEGVHGPSEVHVVILEDR
jgi:L-lactate dehydrogenase complex protein LldG